MVVDAERALKYLKNTLLQTEWKDNQKIKNDPRVTAVGKILRRFSLDELPQFINIFHGEMSLVGPRPIVQEEIPNYGENYQLYTKVKPGLTGLWQVSGRNDLTYEERVNLDEYYVRNWSVWMDIYIIATTINAVMTGKGAY
jgi:lipopolysaccharide/colanic/teichoic acid biosynthesis glycosyltransferase